MNIEDAFPGRYMKAADLNGQSCTEVIDTVVMEPVEGDDKPVLRMRGKKQGLILNKTNAGTLRDALGRQTSDWSGHMIELFPDNVPYQGKIVPAIRVRVPALAPLQPAGLSGNASSFGNPFNNTADWDV